MNGRCPVCRAEAAPGSPPVAIPSRELSAWCDRCQLLFARDLSGPGADWYASFPVYAAPVHDAIDHRELAFFDATGRGPRGRLLDVGCGDGRFLRHAALRGWEPHGIDINPVLLERARKDRGLVNLHLGDLNDPAFDRQLPAFEAITVFEVLEHLSDPVRALERVASFLAPGGLLFVTVPRLDRRPAVFHPEVDAPPHHLTLWTPHAVKRLFAAAGLPEPSVASTPLLWQDLYLHYVWKRYGLDQKGAPGGSLAHLPVKVGLVLQTSALRALGLARGHTLMATLGPRVGRGPL